jgi:hypothetical protein
MKQIQWASFLTVLVLFVSIGLIGEGTAMSREEHVTVHFITPFAIETYVPSTIESIAHESFEVWLTRDHKTVKELQRVLQLKQSLKQIHKKEIRLRADFGNAGGIFYLDREGIILRTTDGSHFELSQEQLAQVENLLDRMVGVVDVKAYLRFGETSPPSSQR